MLPSIWPPAHPLPDKQGQPTNPAGVWHNPPALLLGVKQTGILFPTLRKGPDQKTSRDHSLRDEANAVPKPPVGRTSGRIVKTRVVHHNTHLVQDDEQQHGQKSKCKRDLAPQGDAV